MRKRKILAAAAFTAAAITGGALGLTSAPADAATPSCGSTCTDIYSPAFGGVTSSPAYVLDSYKQGQAAGTPVILFRSSDNDPAEDFQVSPLELVSAFYQAGLVSSPVALRYGCTTGTGKDQFSSCAGSVNDEAYEIEYTPFGADTGMCAGVTATAVAGEDVTLQPCGVSGKTLWIADTSDSPSTTVGNEFPAINGSDTDFSQPFVLTYPGSGYPTDKPRPELYVTNITGESAGTGPVEGTVEDNQLWDAVGGVLP